MKFKKALATALSATIIAGNMTAANVAPVFADDESSDSVKLFNVEKYNITNGTTDTHGDVSFDILDNEVASGAALEFDEVVSSGALIQVTVAPDDGYELDTLTVGGTDVTDQVADNKYTFTLTGNTTVVATFTEEAGAGNVISTAKDIALTDLTNDYQYESGEVFKDYFTAVKASGGEVKAKNASGGSGLQLKGVDLSGFTFTTTVPMQVDISIGNTGSSKTAGVQFVVGAELTGTAASEIFTTTSKTPEVKTIESLPAGTYTVVGKDSNGTRVHNIRFTPIVAESHTVTIDNGITGGTVVADVDEAAEDDDVTLTVTPDSGYELATLTYTPEGGTATDIDKTTKKFTMPDADVTVNATFTAIDYEVTVSNTIENGTVEAVTTANKGDTVTVTVTPATGYKLKADTLKYNDTAVTENAGVYSFEMPAGNVTLTAEFEKETYTVTRAGEEGKEGQVYDGETKVGSFTVSSDTANYGDTVTLVPTAEDGYKLKAFSVTAGGSPVEVTVGGTEEAPTYSFVMPAANATVSAAFMAEGTVTYGVTVNVADVTAGVKGGTVVADSTSAEVGEKVTLTVTEDDGYELDSLQLTGDEVSTSAAVTDGTYEFDMPATDITVNAAFKLKEYTVTASVKDSVGGGLTYAKDTEKINKGTKVTLTATPAEGYQFKALTVDGEKVTATVGADGVATYEVTVGTANITAEAEFESTSTPSEEHSITVDSAITHGTVTPNKTTAAAGEKITLTVTPATADYEITAVKVNGSVITPVEGVYSFDMPDEDVTVTATFEAVVPAGDLTITPNKVQLGYNATVEAKKGETPVTTGLAAAADDTNGSIISDAGLVSALAEGNFKIAAGTDTGFIGITAPTATAVPNPGAEGITLNLIDDGTLGATTNATDKVLIVNGTVIDEYLTAVDSKNDVAVYKDYINGVVDTETNKAKYSDSNFVVKRTKSNDIQAIQIPNVESKGGLSFTTDAAMKVTVSFSSTSGSNTSFIKILEGGIDGTAIELEAVEGGATLAADGKSAYVAGADFKDVSAVLEAGKTYIITAAEGTDSAGTVVNRASKLTTVKFEAVEEAPAGAYKVDVATDIVAEQGEVKVSKTTADADADVEVTPTAKAGYEVDEVSYSYTKAGETEATKVTVPKDATTGKYTFKMPAGDVTVTATFKKAEVTALENVFAIEVQANGTAVEAAEGVVTVPENAETFDVVVKAKQSFKANSLTAALEFDAEGFKVESAKVSDNPAVASLITADVLADAVANAANGKVVTIANFAYEGKALKDVEIAEGAVLATFTFSVAAGSEAGSDFTFTATQVADSNFADTVKQGDKVSVKVAAAAAADDEYYYLLGDADQSGSVNAADASTVLGIAKRSASDVPDWENVFDVVQSGAGHTVDAADAAQILSVAAKNGRLAFTREVDNDVISVKDSSGTVRQYVPITKEVADSITEKYTNAVSLGVVVVNPTKE